MVPSGSVSTPVGDGKSMVRHFHARAPAFAVKLPMTGVGRDLTCSQGVGSSKHETEPRFFTQRRAFGEYAASMSRIDTEM
jgi:hypothetical protein